MELSEKRCPVFNGHPVEVVLSFEMPDRDWYRLSRSRLWRLLESYIFRHETKDIHSQPQEKIGGE